MYALRFKGKKEGNPMKKLFVILALAPAILQADIISDATTLITGFQSLQDTAAAIKTDMIKEDCPASPQHLWKFLVLFQGFVNTSHNSLKDILNVDLGLMDLLNTTVYTASKQKIKDYDKLKAYALHLKGIGTTAQTNTQSQVLLIISIVADAVYNKLINYVNNVPNLNVGKKNTRDSYRAFVNFFKGLSTFSKACSLSADKAQQQALLDQAQKEAETEELEEL